MTALAVLITGASRGIGKGLVEAYLSISKTTVIAAVRDASPRAIQHLTDLPKAPNSQLIVIQMDASSSESISEAIDTLKSAHSIGVLDIVIANAGIAGFSGTLAETPVSLIEKYIHTNAYGPLALFQFTLPLLKNSISPRFVGITSMAGSITQMNTMIPLAAYGASKSLANYFMKWLAMENPEVNTWAIHPGLVASDMGNDGLEELTKMGIDLGVKPIPVKDCVLGIKHVIEGATKEKTAGRFLRHDGNELPW